MSFRTKFLRAKHIIDCFLNKKNRLNSIRKINNATLTTVIETIIQVQNNEFTEEDKQVFQNLHRFRNELSKSNEIIDYKVFNIPDTRTVHEIFRSAASSEIWCQYHYLMAKNLGVRNYLEIGTNLGVSGSYILSALKNRPGSNFITMEGVPKLCAIARNQFRKIASDGRFQIFEGLYQDTFPKVLDLPFEFEICFIDGNHKLEPTLHYFSKLKEKTTRPCVFLFDDIYWSSEMIEAWKRIVIDPDVNFALDLFKMGIVIIDKNEKRKNLIFNFYLDKIL